MTIKWTDLAVSLQHVDAPGTLPVLDPGYAENVGDCVGIGVVGGS